MMSRIQNDIRNILINNIGISSKELYAMSGIESKRDFLNEMDKLIACKSVIKEFDIEYPKYRYSPKVFFLKKQEKDQNSSTKYAIKYIPTSVLETELNYTNSGTDQEDCLDFELQITGYRLSEKDKGFLEAHLGLALDFTKYEYSLWAEYLNPFPKSIDDLNYKPIS